ncbi:mucin-5AC-like [Mytilus californianus]|uniref:mucin-5AC-like n=1 Tax=Mytilus californianus TaxID=6549 RepID=UPI002247C737|nr:mucin-5AC-like [Mytilus californianus]
MDQPFGIVKKELENRFYMFKNNDRISEGNIDVPFTATHRGSINYDCDVIWYDCVDSVTPTTQTNIDSMRSTTIVSPDGSDKHVQNVATADIVSSTKKAKRPLSSNAPLTMPPALDRSTKKPYGTTKTKDTSMHISASTKQFPPKPTSKTTNLPTRSYTDIKVPSEGKHEGIKSTTEPAEELNNPNDSNQDFDSLVETLKLASVNIPIMESSSSNNPIQPTKNSLTTKSESATKAMTPLSTETATKSSPTPKPTEIPPMKPSETNIPIKPTTKISLPTKSESATKAMTPLSTETATKSSETPKPTDIPPMKPSETNIQIKQTTKISLPTATKSESATKAMKPMSTETAIKSSPSSKPTEIPPMKPSKINIPNKLATKISLPTQSKSATKAMTPMSTETATKSSPTPKPTEIPPMKPSKTNIPNKLTTKISLPTKSKSATTAMTPLLIETATKSSLTPKPTDTPPMKPLSTKIPIKPTTKMSLPTTSESATKAMTPMSTAQLTKSPSTLKPNKSTKSSNLKKSTTSKFTISPTKLLTTTPTSETTTLPTRSSTNISKVPSKGIDEWMKSKTEAIEGLNNPNESNQDSDAFVNTQLSASSNNQTMKSSSANNLFKPSTTKISLQTKSEIVTNAMTPLTTETATKDSATPKPTNAPPMKPLTTNIPIKTTTTNAMTPSSNKSLTKSSSTLKPYTSTKDSKLKISVTSRPTISPTKLLTTTRSSTNIKVTSEKQDEGMTSKAEAINVNDNDLARRRKHNQSLKKRLLRLLERRYLNLQQESEEEVLRNISENNNEN